MSISYALSVTNLLSGVVTSFTETEKEMVSVERAMQYIKGTPTEKRDGEIQVSMYFDSLVYNGTLPRNLFNIMCCSIARKKLLTKFIILL